LKNSLRGKTYKYICYELARLRTVWDKRPEIRVAVEKRYRAVVEEFKTRSDNWFWDSHPIDKCLVEEKVEVKEKEIWKVFTTPCIVEKIEQPKHESGPLEGKSIVGVFNYHIGIIRGGKRYHLGKTVNTEVKAGIGDIVEVQISKTGKFKLIKAEDWCAQAGGNWITHGGQHICVNIEDYEKVPEKIRDQVKRQAQKYHKWEYTQKYYKEKRELIDKLTTEFESDDRDRMKRYLERYKLKDLRKMKIGVMTEWNFKRHFDASPKDVPGGGIYRPITGEIELNPINPIGSNLDHEVGHFLYYDKWDRGYSPGIDKLWDNNEIRTSVSRHVDSYGLTNKKEFAAVGFEYAMNHPRVAALLMKKNSNLKEYFEQIEKDTGYKIKKG